MFDYYTGGQLAKATANGKSEDFIWDGLALVHRSGINYINEPHVNGGSPIASNGKVMLNDLLGTNLGVKGDEFTAISRSAFGETSDQTADNFFTGKPMIGELGYAFLMRNYRADQGKWSTADPLGYPNGYNNFAYCDNGVVERIDPLGLAWGQEQFDSHFAIGMGATVNTDTIGITNVIWSDFSDSLYSQISDLVRDYVIAGGGESGGGTVRPSYTFDCGVEFHLNSSGTSSVTTTVTFSWNQYKNGDDYYRNYSWSALINATFSARFNASNAMMYSDSDIAYNYAHTWIGETFSGGGNIKE